MDLRSVKRAAFKFKKELYPGQFNFRYRSQFNSLYYSVNSMIVSGKCICPLKRQIVFKQKSFKTPSTGGPLKENNVKIYGIRFRILPIGASHVNDKVEFIASTVVYRTI